jgi:hypothetical protein
MRSACASSRNSSGTPPDVRNTTGAYPTASGPNRARAASIARSSSRRAEPAAVPARCSSASTSSGSSSCSGHSGTRFDIEIASSVISRSPGWSASAACASATAMSVRVRVVETAARWVADRVTLAKPGNRTRTVTVRPARSFARSRVATRSARCPSVAWSSASSATRRPSADCAPTDRARRRVWICRGSALCASDPSFVPTT